MTQPLLGAPNGTSRHGSYDRWFRYPAGFSQATLEAALNSVEGASGQLVVDPFCGSATVGTATLFGGGRFVGLEAHPLLVELGRLKLSVVPGDAKALRSCAERVAECPNGSSEAETELVQRCFEPETLKVLCGIRDAIGKETRWKGHLTWALLATLRDVASKKVGWPYQRPGQPRTPIAKDARKRFVRRAAMMAEDLEENPIPRSGRILLADSRHSRGWRDLLEGQFADACVTSPPYLNNFDYADATRLEAYFLGRATNWKELCENVRGKMLVATTQQSRVEVASRDLKRLRRWPGVEAKATPLVEKLRDARKLKKRSKEYDLLLCSYLWGIGNVMRQLHDSLRSGARCAWVVGDSAPYGIYIDTPALIGELAEEIGFTDVTRTQLRDRGMRWRKNGTRHQVALSEQLVAFEKT